MALYDTIEEFNVDSKDECYQLNLALHIATKNTVYKKNQLKQTNASVHIVQYRFKIREGVLNMKIFNDPE